MRPYTRKKFFSHLKYAVLGWNREKLSATSVKARPFVCRKQKIYATSKRSRLAELLWRVGDLARPVKSSLGGKWSKRTNGIWKVRKDIGWIYRFDIEFGDLGTEKRERTLTVNSSNHALRTCSSWGDCSSGGFCYRKVREVWVRERESVHDPSPDETSVFVVMSLPRDTRARAKEHEKISFLRWM